MLALCLTEEAAQPLRGQTSDRLGTVILDITKTESISATAQWVKERVGNRGNTQIHLCPFIASLCARKTSLLLTGMIPRMFSRT